MIIESNLAKKIQYEREQSLLSELDKGIDDMEAGRTFPHDEAMERIRKAVSAYAV